MGWDGHIWGLHPVDFDLEEPEIENSMAIANELGAAQMLQQEDPGLPADPFRPAGRRRA